VITDLTPYRKHVDQFDLTEKEKLDLVNAVWMIVDSIYDHHLGLNQLPGKISNQSLTESNCTEPKRQSHSLKKKKPSRQRKREVEAE
jgi:hypothetical protein